MDHDEIAELATPAQLRAWDAVEEHGSISAAAEALGLDRRGVARSYRSLESKLAAKGHSPALNLEGPRFPDSQRLRGVSTLYDRDGNVAQQWVKTEKEDERLEVWRTVIDGLKEEVTPLPPINPPHQTEADLCAVYPVGDHHLGMLSWDKETGADWDVAIGERILERSVDYLVTSAPRARNAVIVFLGDFMHYDSFEAVTPSSRNLLDADGRFPKLVKASVRAMKDMVYRVGRKHTNVRVIVEIGNHDLSSSIFLMEVLDQLFSGSVGVRVDTSPRHFHYYEFGANLLGVHHGHGVKPAALPGIMATDMPREWGRTKHRFWLTGHVHHQRVFEFPGCSVESMRVLAPQDAWSHQKGYRAKRTMQGIILHAQHGEVGRATVNPDMFKED
jgi:hypothetical protein